MTEAAFKACYSEWRMIKTRATVQLVFEIPIEQADAAYQALGGMPIAAKEVWCGIARLSEPVSRQLPPSRPMAAEDKPGRSAQPPVPAERIVRVEKERRKFVELPHSTAAALRCNDPVFRAFLREMCGAPHVHDAESAAIFVRRRCHVGSRSEIKPDTEAETYWLEIEEWFETWKTADRVLA